MTVDQWVGDSLYHKKVVRLVLAMQPYPTLTPE